MTSWHHGTPTFIHFRGCANTYQNSLSRLLHFVKGVFQCLTPVFNIYSIYFFKKLVDRKYWCAFLKHSAAFWYRYILWNDQIILVSRLVTSNTNHFLSYWCIFIVHIVEFHKDNLSILCILIISSPILPFVSLLHISLLLVICIIFITYDINGYVPI